MIWIGGVGMNAVQEVKININQLLSKKHIFISTKESLADVVPVQWGNEVTNGAKKVVLTANTFDNPIY
jgi:hypothetical protein